MNEARSPAAQVWDEATRRSESAKDKGPLDRLQTPVVTGAGKVIEDTVEPPWEPQPMTRLVGNWQPFPDTAPLDREILVRGRWRPFDQLEGGELCVVVGQWSTIMSDGSGHQWYANFLHPFEMINVDFYEWMDIPK